MDRFRGCSGRMNWTKVLLDVGTEGEEGILADSQAYGLGVGEVGNLGVRRCRGSPQGRSPRW